MFLFKLSSRELKAIFVLCLLTFLCVSINVNRNVGLRSYTIHQKNLESQSLPSSPQSYATTSSFRNVNNLLRNDIAIQTMAKRMTAVPANINDIIMSNSPPIPAVYGNLIDTLEFINERNQKDDSNAEVRRENNEEENPTNEDEKSGVKDGTTTIGESKDEESFLPFLWHIPRAGGATIAQIMGECMNLNIATSLSVSSINPSLESFLLDQSDGLRMQRLDDVKYFNVNLDTQEGIERAVSFHLTQETEVDVVISPLIWEIANLLFSQPSSLRSIQSKLPPKGRLFAIFRNPIEREISYFSHQQRKRQKEVADDHSGTTAKNSNDLSIYEISDWIKSPDFIDNYMVRSLIHNFDSSYQIKVKDLLIAKEILRRKCLIGLMDDKNGTIERIKLYLNPKHATKLQTGFTSSGSDDDCQEKLLNWGWRNRNPQRQYVEHGFDTQQHDDAGVVDKESYDLVLQLNQFDMVLYEYAKVLFWEQGIELALSKSD